jgi:hypothetical protein
MVTSRDLSITDAVRSDMRTISVVRKSRVPSAIPISIETHCEGELLDRSPRYIYTVVDPPTRRRAPRDHVDIMILEALSMIHQVRSSSEVSSDPVDH